ncbi:ATP/GTP-binding protein [Streptomyces sp. PTM05]|uniref:ATP/GTP-binding protein n=1 Tax=Streptantibioticus parmotrematis TaxID=2873249 RepID=A0ABS7QVP7_9ACTN|nr:ATP/GTP-binding protein [Streptantibioticus parmotrematis]MBY8887277.1 ATP/GTP-binding protein [Streptantibioticus parmotrematis]
MVYDGCETTSEPAALKILVAGGFGAGKTTLVGAVSEIEPLSTEAVMTDRSTGVDDLRGLESKTRTTVALDFGRITFDHPIPMILYLFGTPGQTRFRFLWRDLGQGAIGAVVLVDTRRLQDSFTAIGWAEAHRLPFVIGINEFETDAHRYTPDEVREALRLPPAVPVLTCDARRRDRVTGLLIALVEHHLHRLATGALR